MTVLPETAGLDTSPNNHLVVGPTFIHTYIYIDFRVPVLTDGAVVALRGLYWRCLKIREQRSLNENRCIKNKPTIGYH